MSSSCYLCVWDAAEVYPSRFPGYLAARHTVACYVNTVPLLWLAGFRKHDMVRRKLDLGGGKELVTAPVAALDAFTGQLRSAVPALEGLFAGSPLSGHATVLEEAVRSTGSAFVTIEWAEIESQDDAASFRAGVREILAFMESPERVSRRAAAIRAKENALPEMEKIRLLRASFPQLGVVEARLALVAAGGRIRDVYRSLAERRTQVEVATAMCGKEPYRPEPDFGDVLLTICGVHAGTRLPSWPPDHPDAFVPLCRLMGAQHERPYPI